MHPHFPLFPLPLVAHPFARIPLQIFEPRYLELVKHSASTQQSFGLVTLDPTAPSGPSTAIYKPTILPIGTAVKIVDFDQLPNGLLGIVCEGQYRFRVHDPVVNDANLLEASIETLAPETEFVLPNEFDDAVGVLIALLEHGYAKRVGYDRARGENYWRQHAVQLSWALASLLPVDDETKYAWLSMDATPERLASIMKAVEQMQS
ncbi:MAG: hypothetical protein HKO06_04745 [Pseudomonadales bacterium]|nr:hypothetical protein [Pseudomonadales bacterium]